MSSSDTYSASIPCQIDVRIKSQEGRKPDLIPENCCHEFTRHLFAKTNDVILGSRGYLIDNLKFFYESA